MRSPLRRRARDPRLPVLPPEPVSREFGFERGRPIDRWYIERFLREHAGDVRGRVLEVAESTYTQWYGDGAVTGSDVLYAASVRVRRRALRAVTTIVRDATVARCARPCAVARAT